MMANRSQTPPRLGRALLHRLADRNEGLAGDLLEEFQITQSCPLFWRQLLWAIITGGFRRPSEIRPLRLVESPSWQPAVTDSAVSRPSRQTNPLAASPIEGIGGIGITALILLTIFVNPSALTLVAVGALLGIAFGVARIVFRRPTVSTTLHLTHSGRRE